MPTESYGNFGLITVRHLWTHSAPLLSIDRAINTSMSREVAISRICAAEADADGDAGNRVGYLGHVGMLLLGEVVARRSGTAFADFSAQELAEPLGLRSRLGGLSLRLIWATCRSSTSRRPASGSTRQLASPAIALPDRSATQLRCASSSWTEERFKAVRCSSLRP
jgi:CubicO group peptidase (beta-lactamase class C family)